MPISIQDQIKCVRREIAMRKAVYAKRVANGAMRPEAAQHELAAMEAVLATLLNVEDASTYG